MQRASVTLPPVPKLEDPAAQRYLQRLLIALQGSYGNTVAPNLQQPYISVPVPNSKSPFDIDSFAAGLPIPEKLFLAASASPTSGTIILLPGAVGSQRIITIQKADAYAQNIIVTPQGSDTIDGQAGVDNIPAALMAWTYLDYAKGQWVKI